jgi:outer membrane lipoprotein-sorting protein
MGPPLGTCSLQGKNVKRNLILLAAVLIFGTLLVSAQNLEAVLSSMDKSAAGFHTAQTDFVWDQYQKVVNEHDLQKGTMYFRRQGDDVQMAADITEPDKKYVLFSGGKVSVYVPKAGQVTEYDAGKDKADFETFLVLGFGGRGHDLAKSFDVNYAGMEQVQGVNAAKLELKPKSQKVANMFQTITLWIDVGRGVSVQQLFSEPSGDYRLAKYNNIRINEKLPNDVFKLKTSGKVTYVRPNS